MQRSRLAGLEGRLLVNIDHHATGRAFADVNWIENDACAVAEMVYKLARAAGAEVSPAMAACLYAALLTDTGSFCYEGTDAHAFELARTLVACGADPARIAREVYFSNPLSKMLLLGAALSNLQREGRLAWLWVTHADMVRTGAAEEDCEGIVNYAIGIAGVEGAVLLRELPDGRVRLSLRSKGQPGCGADRRELWRRRPSACRGLHPGRAARRGNRAHSGDDAAGVDDCGVRLCIECNGTQRESVSLTRNRGRDFEAIRKSAKETPVKRSRSGRACWPRPACAFPPWRRLPKRRTLFCLTAFFLFYGLVPIFGGDGIGLVGADEPRYAQVAREMLSRRDYVTPVLWGHPWLEKPALYYWRAMFAFREFGVHDWSARLPSASFAFMLVVLIYLHIRRFRNGGQLDAALITASCAGILSFARGASTDMQLAAPFCIGMLGWYAWYETNSKFWLFDIYFFVGAATLAKGPVAPLMALVIIGIFAGLRREWSLFRRSLWWPGIVLYFAMVLPWFIAVQRRNPTFLKIFFLQHNLERFATNRFEHYHPFWYYVPVVLLGLTPWAVIAVTSFVDAIGGSINEWKARRSKFHYIGHGRAGDAFPEFLVLWALVPIVFFSFSESKLPGYVLPALPPLTILAGDYLNRIRRPGAQDVDSRAPRHVDGDPDHVRSAHAPAPAQSGGDSSGKGDCGGEHGGGGRDRVHPDHRGPFGLNRLRIATMTPMIILLLYIFGVGPVFGIGPVPNTKRNINLMDMTYSARPLAQILNKISPSPGVVAVWRVRRDVQYGLSFYRNQRVVNYDIGISVSNPPAGADHGPHGVVLDEVKEGSSAEEMGLRSLIGDDVVAVNGQPVLNAADFDAMRAGWKPGVRLEFEVLDPRIPAKNPQFVGGIMQDGIPDKQHCAGGSGICHSGSSPKTAGKGLRAALYLPCPKSGRVRRAGQTSQDNSSSQPVSRFPHFCRDEFPGTRQTRVGAGLDS